MSITWACVLLLFLPCPLAEEPTRARIDLVEVAPAADPGWAKAWTEHHGAIVRLAGIATERQLAHFLAQVAHESGGFLRFEETLDYSARRLRQVWPHRFRSRRRARRFAGRPIALAAEVYGGRMGNSEPGDGWRYRGRGPPQLTGRSMYRVVGAMLGVDLEAQPDRALEPEIGWLAAAAVWRLKGANGPADADDTRGVTLLFNGGETGLKARARWLVRMTRALATNKPIATSSIGEHRHGRVVVPARAPAHAYARRRLVEPPS